MKQVLAAAALTAAAVALVVAAPISLQAATADSILAMKKLERQTQSRNMRRRGCTRESVCVAWAKGIPGTFVGKCTKTAMEWRCPMKVH
jgi:hypothetical protein